MSAATRKRFTLLWVALFVFSLLLQYAQATAPANVLAAAGLRAQTVAGFEVDGNLKPADASVDQADGPNPPGTLTDCTATQSGPGCIPDTLIVSPPMADGTDWNAVGGIINDGYNNPSDKWFNKGKELDTTDWSYKTSQVTPGKDDIAHVMAYAKFVGGDAFFFAGAERVITVGATHLTFELNRKPFKNYGGISKPERSPGDVIITVDFETGGVQPVVSVYEIATVTNFPTGQVVTVGPDISNSTDIRSAVNFVDMPDQGFGYAQPAFSFAEVGINLSALGIHTACPGLAAGFIRTRSGSDPFSSDLKDFVTPFPIDLNNCGSVTIVKNAVPNDAQDFDFTGDLGTFPLDDDANGTLPKSITFDTLTPGTFDVTEADTAGWDLTGLVCDDDNSVVDKGSRTASIHLDPNEHVTCTFTNTERGSITIVKDAQPADPQDWDYTSTSNQSTTIGSFQLDDDSGDPTLPNTRTFSLLKPGTYTVTETLPVAGWDLTDLVCSAGGSGNEGTATATVNLPPGGDVTCTFTNSKRGMIVIVKDTIPNSPQDFHYTTTGTDISPFDLDDDGDSTNGLSNTKTFTGVTAGTYTVTETLPVAGWDNTNLVCIDPTTDTTTNGATATINVSFGETVTCTYENTERGHIIVVKQTVPDGDPEVFHFDASYDGNGFDLSDGQSDDSGAIQPGTYSVSEDVPAGWDLTDATCSDGSLVNAIHLGAAETVTCTFTNTQRGTIIVEKQTLPDGDPASFDFTGDAAGSISDGEQITVSGLVPGQYDSTETVPAGWDLTNITCNDANSSGDEATATATFNVEAGETVKCTFTNTKRGHIIVDKVTDPAKDPASFDFTSAYGDPFSLTDEAEPNDSGAIVPGTYSVDETVPAGWDLTSATCDDQSPVGAISLQPGETVTCTFTNTKRGHIIIEKQTLPDGSLQSFDFDASYDEGGFSLTDGQQDDSGALEPGSYTVDEIVPTGWDLTSIVCDDDNSGPDGSLYVSLEPGETVTCVFTNTQRGTIIVEKQTSPDGALDDFTFSGDAAGAISDGEQIVVDDLVPGEYTSTEADPGVNWDLGAILCDDANSTGSVGTRTATFNVEPGETVTCVFTNVQRGTITIIKDAIPNDARDFGFTTTGSGLSSFSLDDDADATLSNMKTFSSLLSGDYSVTESAVGGWDLTGLDCQVAGGSTATTDGATASLHLATGGSITCVYENTKRGSITVVKDAQPNAAQNFGFTTTGSGLTSFSLDDDADGTLSNTRTFGNLVPGAYSVTESATAGWDLTGISCDSEGATTESRTASIDLEPGEDVTCTYTNEQPSIDLVKTAGDATDGGTYTTLAGPVTYTYVVTNDGELTLSDIVVTDDNGTPAVPGDDFTATCPKTTLAPGESMTCTKTVTVPANRTNTAVARGHTVQGTSVNDDDQAIVVIRTPDTGIDKSHDDSDGIVGPGQTVTYSIDVTIVNGPVTNAVVSDPLPTGQTYVASSATSVPAATSTVYNVTTRTLTWTWASLASGADLGYQVTIDAAAPTGTQTNTATLCVSELKDCKEDSTTVKVPALTIVKSVVNSTTNRGTIALGGKPAVISRVGDTLKYTLTYTLTNGPVHNAVVDDVMQQAGLGTPSNISNGGTYNAVTRTIHWNLGTLTTGGTLTYEIKVIAGADELNQPFKNIATIDSDETNPSSDHANAAVEPTPLRATATPRVTLPPTDTSGTGPDQGATGNGMLMVLLVLAGLATLLGFLTPAPSRVRRRGRRE